ncbi:hypothetical protein FACS1894105_10600 [Clostridia bacterium]|nr:hypothetical protein FACS1894105_10600 [Clostridia bacterium]
MVYGAAQADITITFHPDGGYYNGQTPTKSVEYGVVGALPGDYDSDLPAPVRTGYDFLGWSKTGSYRDFTRDTVLSSQDGSAKTVYALWMAIDIELVLNANGGTLSGGGNEQTFSGLYYGESKNLPSNNNGEAPSKAGYNFLGWGDSSSSTYADYTDQININYTGTKTIYAVWQINVYKLTFDKNHVDAVDGNETFRDLNFGAVVGALPMSSPAAPTREGYTLAGWSHTQGNPNSADFPPTFNMPAANKTVYAVWAATTDNKLKLDANGGTAGILTEINNLTFGSAVGSGLPTNTASGAPTRQGYDFKGWSTTQNGSVDFTSGYTVDWVGEKTVYAVWTATANNVLTFNKNADNATEASPTSKNVTFGAAVGTLPTVGSGSPTRNGYTFEGWSTTSTGTVNFTADYTVNWVGEKIVYAVWTATSNNVLTFNKNADNATEASPASKTVTFDAAVGTLPTVGSGSPTRNGYTFEGWSTTSTGTVNFTADYTVNWVGEKIVYAVWEATANNVLTFNKNADNATEASPTSKNVTFGAAVGTLPAIESGAPTRQGYTFEGWSTTSTGTVNFTADYTVNWVGEKTVYAVWEAIAYKLVLDANTGVNGTVTEITSLTLNAAVGTLPAVGSGAPTKSGYTFQGWSTNSGLDNAVNFTSANVVDSSYEPYKTIYAVWQLITTPPPPTDPTTETTTTPTTTATTETTTSATETTTESSTDPSTEPSTESTTESSTQPTITPTTTVEVTEPTIEPTIESTEAETEPTIEESTTAVANETTTAEVTTERPAVVIVGVVDNVVTLQIGDRFYTAVYDEELEEWLIFDENGVPLGYYDLDDDFEDLDLNDLIPLAVTLITETVSEEVSKTAPKTSDFTVYLSMLIAIAAFAVILAGRKKEDAE